MSRRIGFTLIELLVVIAIIAILAAILFPVFAQARDKARGIKCLSEAKQLGLALQQYKEDYDGVFPIWWSGLVTAADPVNGQVRSRNIWVMELILPYVKNVQVFKCPSDSVRQVTADNGAMSWHVNRNVVFDETKPCIPVPPGGQIGSRYCRGNRPAKSDAEIQHPAATVALAEYWANDATGNYFGRCHNEPESTRALWGRANRRPTIAEIKQLCPRCGDIRHQDGANHVFFDGHAKWYRTEQVIGCYDNLRGPRCVPEPDGSIPSYGVAPVFTSPPPP